MQVKFKASMFLWLKENCGNRSIPSFIVEIIQKEMNGPQKGVSYGRNEEGSIKRDKSLISV